MIKKNIKYEESTLDLPSGSTFITKCGNGPPILFVHGGPGMDHSYLLRDFEFLAADYSLYFYDQTGCGRDSRKSSETDIYTTKKQLRDLVDYLVANSQEQLVLLGHSWGTHLILEVISDLPENTIGKIVLISPMALTWETLQESNQGFINKIPTDLVDEIEALEADGTRESGLKVLEILSPFYVSEGNKCDIDFGDYNAEINATVFNEIEGFDFTEKVNYLNKKTLVMFGGNDFSQPIYWDAARNICDFEVLAGVGHFPFVEDSKQFQKTLRKWLNG